MIIYPYGKDRPGPIRVSRGYFTLKEAELSSWLQRVENDKGQKAKGPYRF